MRPLLLRGLSFLKRLLFILSLLSLLFVLFTCFVLQAGEGPSIAGYSLLSVQSDSMSPALEAGDIILTRPVDPNALKEGDIVTFFSPDPARSGEKVTHRIHHFIQIEGGSAFISKGDASSSLDLYPVPVDQVVGICIARFPKLGYFFQFLRSPLGYLLLVVLPLFLLLCLQLIRLFQLLFQSHLQEVERRQRQQAQINREREQLADTAAYYRFLIRQLENNKDLPPESKNPKN